MGNLENYCRGLNGFVPGPPKHIPNATMVEGGAQLEVLGLWNLPHEWATERTCGDWNTAHCQHYQNNNQIKNQKPNQTQTQSKQINRRRLVGVDFLSSTPLSGRDTVVSISRTAFKQPSWKCPNDAPWFWTSQLSELWENGSLVFINLPGSGVLWQWHQVD